MEGTEKGEGDGLKGEIPLSTWLGTAFALPGLCLGCSTGSLCACIALLKPFQNALSFLWDMPGLGALPAVLVPLEHTLPSPGFTPWQPSEDKQAVPH